MVEHAAALHALGLVALAADEPARAAVLLEEAAGAAGGVASDESVGRRLAPDLIEALGRLGDVRALRVCAGELRARARELSSPTVVGWAAHAAALAAGSEGDAEAALVELQTALLCAERAGEPFELARVLVTFGRSERRLRRKRDARAALARAVRLFAACGAEAWALRAREELARAAGERAGGNGLTVTERRVCERAAEGCSNAEIGAELYVSRRTVEVNLARSYAKLGIRNRAQLGRALAGAGPTAWTPDAEAGRAVRSAYAALGLARRSAVPADASWRATS